MSYILEALKKSEQQRAIGEVPRIDSVHEGVSRAAAGNWMPVIIAVLVLNAGLLLMLLWPNTEPPVEHLAQTIPPPQSEPLLQQPAPAMPREPARQTQRTPPVAEVTAFADPATERPLQPEKPLIPIPAAPPPATPQTETATLATLRHTPAADEVIPVPRPELRSAAGAAVTSGRPPALPVWPQIPGHLFQQLNSGLHLDVHVYSEQVEDRFVLINMHKYHEGEKLQEGPYLDAITSEGVILSFQGQRFQVKAK